MIQFDRSDVYDLGNVPTISEPVPTFAANFFAARESMKLNDQSQSKDKILQELWGPIVDELNETFPNQGFLGRDFENPGDFLNIGLGIYSTQGGPEDRYNFAVNNIMKFMDTNQESLPDSLKGITIDSLEQIAKDRARAARKFNEELAARNLDFSATLGQFTGGVAGIIDDPVNAFGIMGASAKTLWRFALTEAAIGAGVGALAETGVKEWYDELGYDYTYQDFIRNVGFNAVGGAVFGTGIKLSAQSVRKGWDALSKSGRANEDSRAVADAAEAAEEFEADNPFTEPDLPPAQAEHNSRAVAAEAAVENNKAPNMPTEPTIQPKEYESDNLDGIVFKIPAKNILVDAKRFQFKSGGDEFGVTERLQGVTEWNPDYAGTIIVWEDIDGKVFVADGHQRVGLAKRIMSNDPSQEINLIARKFREVDGVTAEQAMIRAAGANIAAADPKVQKSLLVDAAKVLRIDPNKIDELKLPPKSVLVQQARDLVVLNDNAFGAIINEVIPPNYGAIVGRLIDDPDLQDAAIKVLSKSDPQNVFQAEAIVRQVRETDLIKETQVSLFGDEDVATSLYSERAKVLDRTVKLLRADKSSFENLSKNAERIEAEGNKLAKDQNQRRADQDGQAITLLQALANRKGTLSDELSAAARSAKEQGFAAAARNFAESVRRGVERGDFDRAATGDVGRAVDVAPQSRKDAIEEEPTLDGFDEPTGPASEAQVNQMVLDTFRTLEEVTEARPVLQSLKDRQPVETVDDIYKIAQESQDFIVNIAKNIETDLGVKMENPGLKKIGAAQEKMQRKAYQSAKELTDISRVGFITNKASDADAISKRLAQSAEILDEGWSFTPAGYFDRKILVRTPNGIVSEIQIWSPKLIEAKTSKGHKLYKQQEKSNDPKEIQRLETEQRKLYSKALSEEDASFANLLGMEKGPKLSNVDIKALSSAITRPELRTSRPSTAVQEPPGVSIARASEGEKDIAGRPSQETKKVSDIDITPEQRVTDITEEIKPEDFDLEIPLASTLDDEGNPVAITRTLRDIKSDIDAEDALINRLGVCSI
mgnify:CR=1 FL=1